jgi:hypothetical protein
VRDSLPRRIRGQRDARHASAGDRFRLTSGLERRGSGGLARRALVRTQRQGIASRRRRGLNSGVLQPRFGCQQLRRRGIDVLPVGRRLGRRRQQRTVVRRRDSSARALMPRRRHARASDRVAPQKQQERDGKEAHQGTRRCGHVSGWTLTNCSNVPRSSPTIKRAAKWRHHGGAGQRVELRAPGPILQ